MITTIVSCHWTKVESGDTVTVFHTKYNEISIYSFSVGQSSII